MRIRPAGPATPTAPVGPTAPAGPSGPGVVPVGAGTEVAHDVDQHVSGGRCVRAVEPQLDCASARPARRHFHGHRVRHDGAGRREVDAARCWFPGSVARSHGEETNRCRSNHSRVGHHARCANRHRRCPTRSRRQRQPWESTRSPATRRHIAHQRADRAPHRCACPTPEPG